MDNRTIIIGAGITGLVTGILLQRQGVQVEIYEKRKAIESIGGALSIWPNGAEVLLRLPCGADIAKLAGNLKFEHWGDAKGDDLRTVDRDLLLQINSYPFMNICRSELLQLLLKTFGEDKVFFNKTCEKIDQKYNEAIVYFSDGEKVSGNLVIGADGTFSTVRKLIFPELKLNYTGYVSLVGICKFPHNKPKHHIIWGKQRLLLTFPISEERYMVYTNCPLQAGQLKSQLVTREQQLKLFHGWSEEVNQILTTLSQSLLSPEYAAHYFCNENYDIEHVSALYKDRVVLVGDAAHPMGSIVGLGTNIALEDAQTLTDHLQNINNISQALKQFELCQIPRINQFLKLEQDKKIFFLESTDDMYVKFTQLAKTATFNEFFKSIIDVLKRNSTLMPADVVYTEDKKHKTKNTSVLPNNIILWKAFPENDEKMRGANEQTISNSMNPK